MVKKIIYAVLFSCFMHNVLALQLNSDLEEIVKDGKLTVAFVSSSNNQQVKSFDVALATLIADELSVKLDPIYAMNYNEAIALVANKKAELAISNITRTPERGKYVFFSRPYNANTLSMIESRSNASATDSTREKIIKKYNQAGVVLGAVDGAVFAAIGTDYFPKAQIVTYQDEKQMLMDIDNKKINAIISDDLIGKAILRSAPELSLSVTITKVNDWLLEDAIVMNTDHMKLMYWINLFLETLEQDGTLKNMRSQYFSNTAVK